VSFFEQTVILELLNDISCSDLIYAVASTLSIICMLVICSCTIVKRVDTFFKEKYLRTVA